jgi:hypothetical protein
MRFERKWLVGGENAAAIAADRRAKICDAPPIREAGSPEGEG